jgi:RNA polymerase sigma factor (sigma-70 family)
MVATTGLSTRASLLIRLQGNTPDQAAWDQFVNMYGRQIMLWCRRWKLQEADAQDVTQIVLLELAKYLPNFDYDPTRSFRSYLRTVTEHAWSKFISQQQRSVRGSGGTMALDLLQTVAARDDLAKRMADAYDQEMLQIAMDEVRGRVEKHTWDAFQLTAQEQLPAEIVARQLGIRIGTVYRARSVVQNMLRETLTHANRA